MAYAVVATSCVRDGRSLLPQFSAFQNISLPRPANEWNGEGDMPDWLKRVQQVGVDIDFFAVRKQDVTPGVCSPGDAAMPVFFGAR